MKRCATFLLVLIASLVLPVDSAIAQQSTAPSASSPPSSTPTLDCQGCHAPGKTLPYLGGDKFHADAHTAYDRGFHARGIQGGMKAATCVDCHTTNHDLTKILPASDPKSTISRSNIAETCGRCHGDKSIMRGSGISDRPFLSYRESVHAKALAQGNISAAVCTDCHNSHDILPAADPRSPIAKVNIPATCSKCHESESAEFMQSVHGQAVTRGVSRSPVCTDCHGIHGISSPVEQATANATTAVATDTCAGCHEGVALTREFGVAGGRVSSYKDSYHGRSEEHTSELQSLAYLVCRLLLEKKKKTKQSQPSTNKISKHQLKITINYFKSNTRLYYIIVLQSSSLYDASLIPSLNIAAHAACC